MRRGITLLETLAVLTIIAIVAGISYPVFLRSRESALESVSISRLKQMGVAVALYREQSNGQDFGSPSEMGLPLAGVPLQDSLSVPKEVLTCAAPKNVRIEPRYGPGLILMSAIPGPPADPEFRRALEEQWTKLSRIHGSAMPFAGMMCHNSPESASQGDFAIRKGLGVSVSGGLIRKNAPGDFGALQWWLPSEENK